MSRRILIANRGVAATRLIRTIRAGGDVPVAICSEADEGALWCRLADEVHCVGPASAAASYLNADAILDVVRDRGIDAVHPGYGFLAESPAFATAVRDAGVTFIGPSPDWLDRFGDKTRARDFLAAEGMPVVPASPPFGRDVADLDALAAAVGYPLMVKPAGGGGGIGMVRVDAPATLAKSVKRAADVAGRYFGDETVYLERCLDDPRHVEFQIVGGASGCRHLGARDCSVQRRFQKVVEETPVPLLDPTTVAEMADRAAAILGRVGYDSLGTVEMLHTRADGFAFLEVNPRLQVEHGITEAVTGIDLVAAQMRLATGATAADVVPPDVSFDGHAIEVRIYAEDPVRLMPSPGRITEMVLPDGDAVRVDAGYAAGDTVPPYYDPMVAIMIAHDADREAATRTLIEALARTRIEGIKTNIPFLMRILESPDFRTGRVGTGLVGRLN
ncbi:MAG: biotin carboxylase N-terminal domain-containing protein [Azospirillaceae bacterium]